MLSVDEALARVLDGVTPLEAEACPIMEASGRTLAAPLAALLSQPPFYASAMDGYAVRSTDVQKSPTSLSVIGQAAAGHPFDGQVLSGQAVRIFTGAPLPAGADFVVIQENTTRAGPNVTINEGLLADHNVRQKGCDFTQGEQLLESGLKLGGRELSLAAAMGHGTLLVRRAPEVAVLATGDELVLPADVPSGDSPFEARLGAGRILASNHLGVLAMASAAGARSRFLGIARDTAASLDAAIARADCADILVTLGGASVGDHDLVAAALQTRGFKLSFAKIAMRPGKPMMFGARGGTRVLGLPGNPVSGLLCARIFLVPLIEALLGRPSSHAAPQRARLAVELEPNGPRRHYMRATLTLGSQGALVAPLPSQDSSLLATLARANCLIIRPEHAPAAAKGDDVSVLPLDF